MRNRQLILVSVLLAGVGLAVFAYKLEVVGLPLLPAAETRVWDVEARVAFRATGGPAKVLLRIPDATPGLLVLDENYVSYGYGLTTQSVPGGRAAVWAKRRPRGRQALYYRAVVAREPGVGAPPEPPGPRKKAEYEEPFREAALSILDDVRARSADVATFVVELLERLSDPSPDEAVSVVLSQPRLRDKIDVAVYLLAGARIPAERVQGLRLEERREAPIETWLAVHDGERWLYLDPETGRLGLPDDVLIWWRGNDPVLRVEGYSGRTPEVEFAVVESIESTLDLVRGREQQRDAALYRLSIFSLPVRTQAVFSVLLLVPLGGLIVVLARNVVGLPSFGTFMPILMALAFRSTHLAWGIGLFVLVVALGLSVRSYLERLKLLLVPRLAAVLTVVVIAMAALSVVSHQLSLEQGLSLALFPIVILTMVIERISLVWEERGPQEALRESAGSLVIAVLAFSVFSSPVVRHLMLVFPELLLVILALTLLLGRYSGYRLLELHRFRALSGAGEVG
ncbi:MAG: UUP1 family membrane protein [Myxococcota bacterium]|nr:UUP1 family membrane protein [Myxococcota bacterium]